jgi:hypothetical protein
MAQLTPIAGLAAVALLVSACTGGDASSDPIPTTEPGPVSTTTQRPGAVTEAGAVVTLDDGFTLDAGPGAFPAGTQLTVETTEPLDLPSELTPLGPGYRIEAPVDATEPVAVMIPLPEGEGSDGIAIAHVRDGEIELIGGQVIDGVFHTALTSFSEVQLLKARIDEITGIAGVPPVDLGLEGTEAESGPLAVEHGQLVTGVRSEPVPRIVSIVGPAEPPVGRPSVYTATGFASEHPEFLEYEWRVSGRNEADVPGDGIVQRQLFVGFQTTGRYTITVDVRDPVTGAEAFAALTVFVDAEAFAVIANPPIAIGSKPYAEVNIVNGVGTVDLLWAFYPGPGGRTSVDAATGPVFFEPGVETLETDTTFEILATDESGNQSYAMIALTATEDTRPAGAIVGPASLEVGEEAVFSALTQNASGLPLTWAAEPPVESDLDGDVVTLAWDEPGIARVGLFALFDDGEGPIPIHLDTVAVAIEGDPLPLAVSHRTPPDTLMVDGTGTWTARIRGGIVAAATGLRGYRLTVDFGDGTIETHEIPARSALEGAFRELTHAYEEGGTYEITLTATSSDGQEDSATTSVVVSDRIIVEAQILIADDLPFPFSVLANRIRIVIFEDGVRLRVFEYTSESMPFGRFTIDSQGEESSAADCTSLHEILSHQFEGTYDRETGVVSGTVFFDRHRSNTGPECPFGGYDVVESRTGTLEATIADGAVSGSIVTADGEEPAFTYVFEGTVADE